MAGVITKYAVLSRRTVLQLHTNVDVPDEAATEETLSVVAGTLIKVFQTQVPHKKGKNDKVSTVQVLDFVRHDPVYENLYECPQNNLLKVSESLWPYVISIVEPESRLKFIQNTEQRGLVTYLKNNDLVSVAGEAFGRTGIRYDCIIRYIGPVQELYAVGYFFGLEMLHLDNGYSPQSEDIPFSIKYMQCDPSLSIFVTANWISTIPNDIKKKFSPYDIFSDALEKVRQTIGPSSCSGGSSNSFTGVYNSSSLRKTKKIKKKEPTAQFYAVERDEEELNANSTTNSNTMERRIQNNSNGENPKQLISLENDDVKTSIENYEKTLERQRANSTLIGVSTEVASPQPPTGILKHRSTASSSSVGTKPTTILCLDDRDIIVIDKADIQESTKNESDVIVVDKSLQQDVDLADLLGGNWPSSAGSAASILNKTQKQQVAQDHKSSGVIANATVNNINNNNNNNNNLIDNNQVTLRKDRNIPPIAAAALQQLQYATERTNLRDNDSCNLKNPYDKATDGYPLLLPAVEHDFVQSSPLQEVPDSGLGVGSMVEVSIPEASEDLYGVIRWIGMPPGAKSVMVGVELEEEHGDKNILTTDGSFNNLPLFVCPEGRAIFVTPEHCKNDRRFADAEGNRPLSVTNVKRDSKMFGQVECPSVPGAVAPLKIYNLEELDQLCGKFKGIQGHHNSCYLDATLFSMFTFTSVFDSLLFRPPEPEDISSYTEVQKVLREEIVNPLRKNMFVRADRVMKLRKLLDKLSSVSGLTSEEKDPEEFLNSLLAQIMRVEPFLKLNSGQDAYYYQLFVEKDERLSFPTVQQLFEQSFHSSDIKLKEVPSCLIIQMPRFGKNYKMYPRILPSQVLDVTDIIEDTPRQCSVCGNLAEFECRDCFGNLPQGGVGLESTAFCQTCLKKAHQHAKRTNHTPKNLSVPQDFRIMAEHMTVPRLYMELFAVVCIETSHYVAFVKAASGADAPWCFFDSMADRKGEKNGYNIPEMIIVPDLPQWLSEDGARDVNESSSNDKMLPEHAKRLFCDAYMCMYQSTDVMMYR